LPEFSSYDVVIVGGAVTGSSCAFWLTRRMRRGRVLVVEPEPDYARAATALSVASIRMQFSTEVNVRMSQFGVSFIRDIARHLGPAGEVADLGFREQGYLFLAGSDEQARNMLKNKELQHDLGVQTEVLEPREIRRRFGFLELGDVVLGSFGPSGEGWFDNMGLLGGLRRAARAAGAEYVADRVVGMRCGDGRVQHVQLASGAEVAAGAVIDAAGTRGAVVARMAGVEIPVEPRKRTVFVIDAPGARHPDAPLLVDHTGFYLRPEGSHWLCATVPEQDPPVAEDDFAPDHVQFEEHLWPRLYARAPGFDAVKVLRMWAGHYDFNRFDANAIVGRAPGVANFYLVNGFSGHGLQQAPAVGRAISELILDGRFKSLDLSVLSPERILTGRPVRENEIV